jgi:hypothetical protein
MGTRARLSEMGRCLRFPPGRLRLATRPALTASSPVVKTTGIVVVTALAARAETVPPVAAPHCFVNINA